MGLILPQQIEIKWHPNTKQHYIDLGYQFSRNGEFFNVHVLDLTKGSSLKVKVQCDYCGKVIEKPWKDFLQLRGSKYCCKECLTHKKKTIDENGRLIFVEIPYRNKNWLFNEYVAKNREAKDIAKECGINIRTLREWISMLGIEKKSIKTRHITKEILIDLYTVQHKSTLEIGEMYGISDGTVLNLMKKYNIPSFSYSEAYKFYLYEKGGLEKARKLQSTMENRIRSSCRQHGITIEDFKGFSTTEQHMARNNTYYKEWKRKIFERDDYTCQCCGKRGGNLNAHHLYNFSEYKDLRYDINNGITLCEKCHLINYPGSFHAIYGERNNTPWQIHEFINNNKEKIS